MMHSLTDEVAETGVYLSYWVAGMSSNVKSVAAGTSYSSFTVICLVNLTPSRTDWQMNRAGSVSAARVTGDV